MQCFNALGTETAKPSQAAQCVGYIACAELPRNQWQDLISKLFDIKKILMSVLTSVDCMCVYHLRTLG